MPTHPTALVHPDAFVDVAATVGPFCTVGAGAHLGPGSRLLSHVVVDGQVRLEAGCVVHPFAVLGGSPQIVDEQDATGQLHLGAGCVVREAATLSLGSSRGDGTTRLGPGCMLMANCHVGHDCQLGARVLMANGVLLAGHVQVEDDVGLGGGAGVHQFCRLGRLSFVGAGAMVAKDVPPFTLVQGDRACLRGLNLTGLKRAGVAGAQLRALRRAYQLLFCPGASRQESLARCRQQLAERCALVAALCDFVAAAGRGTVAIRPAVAGGGGWPALAPALAGAAAAAEAGTPPPQRAPAAAVGPAAQPSASLP